MPLVLKGGFQRVENNIHLLLKFKKLLYCLGICSEKSYNFRNNIFELSEK